MRRLARLVRLRGPRRQRDQRGRRRRRCGGDVTTPVEAELVAAELVVVQQRGDAADAGRELHERARGL
jgi:hypothetical protein